MKNLVAASILTVAACTGARADDGAAPMVDNAAEPVGEMPGDAGAPEANVVPQASAEPQPSVSETIFFDFAIGGGSVVGFTDPLSSGHLVYGGLTFHWGDIAVGIHGSGIYPGSRVQTRFGALIVDARYYFIGLRDTLAPYVVGGIGFSSNDALGRRAPPTDVVRWTGDAPSFVFSPGVGLRWGLQSGLFIHAEARVINASHAIFTMGGGFAL